MANLTKEIRQQVYAKYGGKCAYCGEDVLYKDFQADHIVPKYHFELNLPSTTGLERDSLDNLIPSCRVCNKRKDTFTIEDFRKEIEMQIFRLNKYNSSYRFAKKYNLLEEKEKPIVFYFEKFL